MNKSEKAKFAVIESSYANKEDAALLRTEIHRIISRQTKWIAATIIGTVGLAIAVAKLIF